MQRRFRGLQTNYSLIKKEMQNSLTENNYEYNAINATTLHLRLSPERLTRYAELAPTSIIKQLQLYAWNTALSESLYTPIQGLEIVARNHFHVQLTEHFGEKWYNNPQIKFAYPQASVLKQAENTLKKEKKMIVPSNLISLLPFGFWTGLLGPKYETTIWRTCLYNAFTNKPVPFLRKTAHYEFNRICILRNRIAHHEPILKMDLINHYTWLIKMINWFCKEMACWINGQSRFVIIWKAPINPFLS